MLRVLSLRDFVIVAALEVDFRAGFSVLTGETGAGKSILIDALQLALGGRGDAIVVRDGAARADIAATFDTPASLGPWLDDAGFANDDSAHTLLLRRSIDAQGRSRAWVNGVSATVTQLREAADHLVDIHGQHAWQSLTRSAAVRALVDDHGDIDTRPLAAAHARWQDAKRAHALATSAAGERERERERLAWQVGELAKLAPRNDEWADLNEEHKRLSNAQSLIDAASLASEALAEADDNAQSLVERAVHALGNVVDVDARLQAPLEVLKGAQMQLDDAAHTLRGYLQHTDLDPKRLAVVDERMGMWMGLARRFKVAPPDLAEAFDQWQLELKALAQAADVDALARAVADAEKGLREQAAVVSRARAKSAPLLASAVTAAMQTLGMAGGRLEVALTPLDEPQAHGLESIDLLVAGHGGAIAKPIGKVASGGELSRLALAMAVTGAERRASKAREANQLEPSPATLIFDEVDAGVGGTVADTVGLLMQRLGRERQVLAVTHLAQVAACADHHYVVSKSGGKPSRAASKTTSKTTPSTDQAASDVRAIDAHDERVREIARMLGGNTLATSTAHAEQLLKRAANAGVASKGSAPRAKPTNVTNKTAHSRKR